MKEKQTTLIVAEKATPSKSHLSGTKKIYTTPLVAKQLVLSKVVAGLSFGGED